MPDAPESPASSRRALPTLIRDEGRRARADLLVASRIVRSHPLLAYPLALALAIVALVARLSFGGPELGLPFLGFFPAIAIAAFFGGAGPGFVATAASALLSTWFLLPPVRSLEMEWPGGAVSLLAFVATCALIVVLTSSALTAVDRARRAEARLAKLAEDLDQRVVERTAAFEKAEGERREAEHRLHQAQKMESIGQLTGGIAHDFNNMLAIVMGSIEMAKRRIADQNLYRALTSLDAASEGARRAAELTARLLAFSRQQPLRPGVVDANKLVASMSELMRRTLGETIEVETVLGSGLWRVFADPSQLEGTLVNLAVNARDAMEKGGRLTVETANAELDDDYARRTTDVAPGQYVMIGVTDTGEGMTPEVAARAFEPFFSTKVVGKGTGLGLSQVHGFVKQSGGHVKIYSEPGMGTTVKIYLPRYAGPATETVRTPESYAAIPQGDPAKVVLVVEDEPHVLSTAVAALRELGYTVVHAGDGPRALECLARVGHVDLLFTDIVMPGMTGRELADEARRRDPALKVVYATGYTRNAVVHNGTVDAGVELLTKPYTYEQLARKIDRALAEA